VLIDNIGAVYSNELNSILVTTPQTTVSAVSHPQVISIVLNDGSRLLTSYKFMYRQNPRFWNIEPRNHLLMYVQ